MESADTHLFVQAKESCGTHSMTACYSMWLGLLIFIYVFLVAHVCVAVHDVNTTVWHLSVQASHEAYRLSRQT